MKRALFAVLGAVLFSSASVHAAENALFGRTHRLPTPYTLPAGTLALGTEAALGVTDFFQVGTSVFRDFYGIYNANAKASLIDQRSYAAALTFGWESYNLKDVSPLNPDVKVTSYLPGVVTAFALAPELALFAGGNLRSTQATGVGEDRALNSGYFRGAAVGADLSWAYDVLWDSESPTEGEDGASSSDAAVMGAISKKGAAGRAASKARARRRGRLGNVLSVGASYDLSYELLGVGVSHHWPGFQVGIHYYPNADRYKVQPILAGGMVLEM